MNNLPESRSAYNDEISLVDLATTFIRRRKVFYVVFLIVMAIAGAYLLLKPAASSSYTTVIQLATLPMERDEPQPDKGQPVIAERVATVIATINAHWKPEAQERYQAEHGEPMPGVSASSVENTRLISLTSTGANQEVVRQAHERLASLVVDNQHQQLERRMDIINRQLDDLNGIIKQFGPASIATAQAIETRSDLQEEIARAERAEVLALAGAGQAKGGVSATLVVALAAVLGLMLGVFAAFLAEFVAQVRRALSGPSQARGARQNQDAAAG